VISASQEARALQIVLEGYARIGGGVVMEFEAVLALVCGEDDDLVPQRLR
jgi:hypothetical protein